MQWFTGPAIASSSLTTIQSFETREPISKFAAKPAMVARPSKKPSPLGPDLLILDVVMPELNGVEVATILKASLPEMKTILSTMYEYVGEALAAAAGVNVVFAQTRRLCAPYKAVESLLGAPAKEVLPQTDHGLHYLDKPTTEPLE